MSTVHLSFGGSVDAEQPGPLETHGPMVGRPVFVRRVRRVGVIALTLLLAVMSLRQAAPGQLLGLAVLAFGLLVAELLWRARGRPEVELPWLRVASTILLVMTAVIALTGGVDSILLILYVPAAFTLGLATPKAAWWLIFAPAALIFGLIGLAHLSADDARWILSWEIGGVSRTATHNALLPIAVALFAAACFRLGRETRAELVESRRQAVEAQRARVQAHAERHAHLLGMVGAVAHELKNPLTSVQSLTSHLHRKAPEASSEREALTVVRSEVGRIRVTVDALLNSARPLSGHVVTGGDLAGVAADVVDTHRTLAADKGVALAVVPGAAPAAFDRRKLIQAAGNLVLNAIEACDPGHTVEVEVGSDVDGVWLAVRDDGPGLAAEVRDELGRPGVTTKVGGSGIGLALSRGIVEQHRGHLTLSDRPTGGCRARIWLPREREGSR